MIRVYIERRVEREMVEVSVAREFPEGRFYLDPDGWRWQAMPVGGTSRPVLTVDYEVWEAIVDEILGTEKPSTIMADGWLDARTVRDRLLTIVEEAMKE